MRIDSIDITPKALVKQLRATLFYPQVILVEICRSRLFQHFRSFLFIHWDIQHFTIVLRRIGEMALFILVHIIMIMTCITRLTATDALILRCTQTEANRE